MIELFSEAKYLWLKSAEKVSLKSAEKSRTVPVADPLDAYASKNKTVGRKLKNED